MTRHGSHTESRMRENCTYGSMRGRAFPTGRPALLYTLAPLLRIARSAIPTKLCLVIIFHRRIYRTAGRERGDPNAGVLPDRKSQRGYVLKYAPNFYSELQAMGLHGLQRKRK